MFVAVLIIFGGCATGKKVYKPKEDEELFGPWIHSDYYKEGEKEKIIYDPDGTHFVFIFEKDSEPIEENPYTIIDKWTDKDGNIWYKGTLIIPKTHNSFYLLIKISNSATVYEEVRESADYPTEIDVNHYYYVIYYRQ
jgi:hypothetical protein